MRKVLIIGAGGIGSFLIPILDKVGLYRIHVADPDGVETKNLPYQNFKKGHVGQNKASVMMDSYESVSTFSKYPVLTEKQMQGYDLVICCVDNLSVRRTLYNTSIKWLDLRAQGRNAAFVSHNSCQGDSWDGTNSNVHFMQVAIAGLGAQWVQRFFNDEDVREYMVVNV